MGYKKDVDWVEFEVKTPKEIPEKALDVADIVVKRNKLRMGQAKSTKGLLPYAKGVSEVIDEAYQDLYGFAPLSGRQVDWVYEAVFSPHYH